MDHELVQILIGGGIFATLIGLLVENYLAFRKESKFHKDQELQLKNFLIGWHSDAISYIKVTLNNSNKALFDWQEYQQLMEREEDQGRVFPWLPYDRFILPDCAPMVSSSLRYLSPNAYGNLLYLNGRLKLINERNSRFEDFFVACLQTNLTAKTRAKAAKIIVDSLKNNITTANEALKFAEGQDLCMWLNKQHNKT